MTTVFECTIEEAVSEVLRGIDGIDVLLGPVLRHPETDERYFPVAVSREGFWPDAILGGRDDRAAFKMELMRRSPIIVHDFDDELALLRFASSIWPGEEIKTLYNAVKKELGPEFSPHSPCC